MAENDIRNDSQPTTAGFREAVCIDAGRVYDSCCDRDCLEDLRCFFAPDAQVMVEKAISVRLKSAEVLNVFINVEPVNFNKGFYSCDLTFFFVLEFDLFMSPNACPVQITGITAFNKRVILYGSDGNVKIFSSMYREDDDSCEKSAKSTSNMPKCVVQCVDPVALSARLGHIHDCYESVTYIPKSVCDAVGGTIATELPIGTTAVYATIGLFTIVQLIRNVQMLIPVYDFCIPEKHCDDRTDQPCDAFRRIKFPTDDFFPPRSANADCDCGCGCSHND